MNPIDIIIVNYESTEPLMRLLRSVYQVLDGRPANILVQDNHSADGVERISELFPQVILTINERNLGFARAANRAIRQSGALYLFLLNPDVIVKSGFFDSIIEYMERNPDVGIAGPRILNPDGSLQGFRQGLSEPCDLHLWPQFPPLQNSPEQSIQQNEQPERL